MLRFIGIIWGILLISGILDMSSGQACSTLPLSVSSLDSCEDNNCRTTETAQIRLELNKGFTSCIRIESTGTQVAPAVFNISIIDSVLVYPLVDCYFSDDPQIDISSFCGCPGGTSVSCDNCPNTNPVGMDVLCTSGLHNSKGCLLGGAGTWCSKIGFTGFNRYKVCDIGSPELQLSFKYFDTVTTKVHIVNNPTIFTLGNTVFNITLLDFEVSDREKTEFMVWDTLQLNNFYLIPERFVNYHDTYDPSKLGWYKSNKTVAITNEFFKSASNQVTNCGQNQVAMGTSAVHFADFLPINTDYCAQRVAPGVILRDPGFPLLSASTGEDNDFIQPYKNGMYFTNIDGGVVFFGLDDDNNVRPTPYWAANGWTITTLTGSVTGNFLCSNGTHMYTGLAYSYNLVICQQLDSAVPADVGVNWGLCLVTAAIATGAVGYDCTDITFSAFSYPDDTLQTYVFNTSGIVQISNTQPSIKELSDSILVPVKKGSATALLEFKNVTFIFDTINAIPHIDSVDDTSGDIVVVASSKTVPGNCVLMVSNDIGPTVSVFLALVNNKYRIPVTTKKFDGNVIITLQCYKNTDSVSLDIKVDKGDPDVIERTINQTSVREASMSNPSAWSSFLKSANKFASFLGGGFSKIFSLTNNKIWSFLLGVLIVVSILAAIPLSLMIIWKATAYTYRRIRNRKRTSGPAVTRVANGSKLKFT